MGLLPEERPGPGAFVMSVRIFRDPQGSNPVGGLIETPDIDALEAALQTEEAAAAMKHDGVRSETLLILVEG